MIPLPNLSNNQSAAASQSLGTFIVTSGGSDLRTMLEYAKGNSETGGYGLTTSPGSVSRFVDGNVSANLGIPGAKAGFSFGIVPILIGGALLLWMKFKK